MTDTTTPELSAAQVAARHALINKVIEINCGSDPKDIRAFANLAPGPRYQLSQAEKIVDAILATRPSAPADAPVVVEFGKGALVVDTGTYGGAAAVFVAPTPSGNCGPVGHHARDEDRSPLDRLSPGEQVWTFPSKEQADAVYAAIFGIACDAPLPAAPADQGNPGPEWRDIISAPRGGEIVKLGWWVGNQFVSTQGRYVRSLACWADDENHRLEPQKWAPVDQGSAG